MSNPHICFFYNIIHVHVLMYNYVYFSSIYTWTCLFPPSSKPTASLMASNTMRWGGDCLIIFTISSVKLQESNLFCTSSRVRRSLPRETRRGPWLTSLKKEIGGGGKVIEVFLAIFCQFEACGGSALLLSSCCSSMR